MNDPSPKRILATTLAAAFLTSFVHAEADQPPAPEPSREAAALAAPAKDDPKATCLAFLEAVRRCDLDAALKCCVYEAVDEEAMKVAVGIWIAHRNFGKAVEKRFGTDEKHRELLAGWLRPDVTDKALEETEKRLPQAEVRLNGDTLARVDLRWEDQGSEAEHFNIPAQQLLKVDGVWKLDAGGKTEDFFGKGGWGNVLRDGVALMNETVAKLDKGDFKTVEALKAFLDERQKVIQERYEKELREAGEED